MSVGSVTVIAHDGLTLVGIEHVMVFVFDPTLVLPLYVVIVNAIDTEIPVVF